MRRHVAALFVGLSGAWILAAGCTASGSDARINGPSYDLEAGGDDGGGDASAAADGTSPSPVDGATTKDAPSPGDDASAPDAASADDATSAPDAPGANDAGGCTSTTAILGGNDFSLFGAIAVGTSAFTTATLSGGVALTPALVAFGGGFQALFTETLDASAGSGLVAVGYASGAWSTPSALGGGAVAIDAPAAAAVGATLQAVYLNPQHLYFQASFATAWDTGATAVRPPNDAGVTAFGPVRAAAAGTATELVIAYEGSNQLPYAQTWTSGAGWDDGVQLGSATLVANMPMAAVSLDAGASDVLAVYVDGEGAGSANNIHLFFVLRSGATKAWSSPAIVNVNAFTESAPTLTAMSGGRALLAWQGQTGGVYGSVLTTAGGTPAWSAPAQITSASPPGAPSLAAGVCGDDAVAAYLSLGSVYTTHFTGGAWTAPTPLAGPAGVTSVSIATEP